MSWAVDGTQKTFDDAWTGVYHTPKVNGHEENGDMGRKPETNGSMKENGVGERSDAENGLSTMGNIVGNEDKAVR